MKNFIEKKYFYITALLIIIIDQITKLYFQDLLKFGIVYFAGDGAEKCSNLIKHDNARFLTDIYPSAKEMAMMSAQKYTASEFEDVAYFEPFYLKDFVAGKPKNYFN